MDLMENRLHGLGVGWPDVSRRGRLRVHPLEKILPEVILKRMGSAGGLGVRWYFSRPPIVGIEFEMDIRVRAELEPQWDSEILTRGKTLTLTRCFGQYRILRDVATCARSRGGSCCPASYRATFVRPGRAGGLAALAS